MSDLPPEFDDRSTYMTKAEIFVDDYARRVDSIAMREHKHSTIFTVEDLKQEIWAAVFKEFEKLVGKPEGFIINFMNRAAGRFAEKSRIEQMYQTGTFIYTPDLVKVQLELDAWNSDPGGDWDMRLDVRAAFDSLSAKHQDLIFRAYRLDESFKDNPSARKELSRARDHMAHFLNNGAHVRTVSLDDVLREEA